MAEKNEGKSANDFKNTLLDEGTTKEMNQMFLRIINKTDVNVRSQQRSEKDLTNEQKLQILKGIFRKDPRIFLSRFGNCISMDDLRCFCAASGSDMEYAIAALEKRLRAKASGVFVKNRRYEALQRLERNTDYFSDDEMRQRCPFLYEQYIGQYMTEEEKFAHDEAKMKDEVKMSSFIFEQMDRDWLKKKEMDEREQEECMEEEEEDDDEEQDEDSEICGKNDEGHYRDSKGYCEDKVGYYKDTNRGMEDNEANTSSEFINLSSEDKLKLRDEFLNIMRQRFLEGQDEDFDYSNVDTSDEYDNLEMLGQDEEDKYFDEEEPEMMSKSDSKQENMSADSEEEDYLSDKILEKCFASSKS